MNFARTALFLVVLSVSAIAAEPTMNDAQHAGNADAAAVATMQGRPEFSPKDVERYNQAVSACLVGRQEFGNPNPGMAPLDVVR